MRKFLSFIKYKLKFIAVSLSCIVFAFIILKNPQLSSDGITSGLELCAQTMIPSIFPFLVLSSFILRSGINDCAAKRTDKFFEKFFHFSGTAGGIFITSLFAGFPVGSSMSGKMYEEKKISKSEAQRLIMCGVNAGPAFIIGAVGSAMLSSVKAGVVIFVSLTLSSVIIAFLSSYLFENDKYFSSSVAEKEKVSTAFVNSVGDATTAMLSISAWIIFFSCICSLITGSSQSETFKTVLKSILEVSVGCKASAKLNNLPLISAVLGWSGLCVHCQVAPAIIKTGLSFKLFLSAKLFNAAISSLLSFLLFKLFPCDITVFSSGASPVLKAFAVSGPAAAGLMLMCAILILDLDTNKNVC